jgi:23S rRNA (cytosine1962-C5)-methyltransferase
MARRTPDPMAVLKVALERRNSDGRPLHTNVYRVLNGLGDGGPPGLTLDRYADTLVLRARDSALNHLQGYREAAEALIPSRCIACFALGRTPGESRLASLSGPDTNGAVEVEERGVRFACDISGGASGLGTGLFIDHRETRLWVRQAAEGLEVLNLFAYTGGFSVNAALGGAKKVVSVDASKRVLSVGQENMRLNGLDSGQHQWVPDDALSFVRRKRRYDLIIVDPPVFGRAGKRVFSLERDLANLLVAAAAALRPGGHLLLSIHALTLGTQDLERLVRDAAGRRKVHVRHRAGLPEWDHPMGATSKVADDRGDYLKTLVIEII